MTSAVDPSHEGFWVPNLFPKQMEVFNCRSKILLVCGPRIAGKTLACLHRIVRHMWETQGASVGFFAKSVKSAKESGPWQQLVEQVIPEWIEAGIGLDFTTLDGTGTPGQKQDAQTRSAYFKIRNIWGGESECRLFSIDHDHEAGQKVKSKVFSMIFFSELSNFKDSRILTTTLPSLRMPHLLPPADQEDAPDVNQMWLGDTNPDEDLGRRSWFYKVFYIDRMAKDHKQPLLQKSMNVIEFKMKDNPYVRRFQIEELEGLCGGDQALYDSYVLGIHGDGGVKADRLFSKHFSRKLHVVGGGDSEGDQIDIHTTTSELFSGWDLGSSVNHGAGILEKWFRKKDGVDQACWSVIDELVYLNEQVSLEDFALNFLAKMRELEGRYKRKFHWKHWSDDSSVNVWRASSGSYDYAEILAATKGEIELEGVDMPAGSVESRVRLLRKFLREERIFISARCPHVIAMLEEAKRGDDVKKSFLADQHKHTFDWLTYPLYMEAMDELFETASRPTATDQSLDYFGTE